MIFRLIITGLNNQSRNHFDSNHTNLQALDSGLIAHKLISCANTKNIGIIQQSLDNVAVSNMFIKQLQQAITLGHS